jgi:hypothetical protein
MKSMKSVILQIWEESVGGRVIPDGCSLHVDNFNRNKFINSIYNNRVFMDIPHSYERIVGSPTRVFVNNKLFNLLMSQKNIRLMSHEMNNLLMRGDIISSCD